MVSYDPGMDHIVRGTRSQVLDALFKLAEGWDHLGSDVNVARALKAYELVGSGVDVVEVGHTKYCVEETVSH